MKRTVTMAFVLLLLASLLIPIAAAKGGSSGGSSYNTGGGVYYRSGSDDDDDEEDSYWDSDWIEIICLGLFIPIFIVGWIVKKSKGQKNKDW